MFTTWFLKGNTSDPRFQMRHIEESNHAATQMVILPECERIEREGTAEIKNDPRFFAENVITKRLEAFEAMAIITELMSAMAVKQCFELTNEFSLTGGMLHVAIFQLIGFFLMVSVMIMSTVATAVLSLQLFFTIRLLTVGPTGFDKAAFFYSDKKMWRWRERAIFGVKWSLVFFTLSTGFMLYVKFYTEGAPIVEHESEEARVEEYHGHKVLAGAVLAVFMLGVGFLVQLVREHSAAFEMSYSSLDTCHNDLNRHLISQRY